MPEVTDAEMVEIARRIAPSRPMCCVAYALRGTPGAVHFKPAGPAMTGITWDGGTP